MEVTADKEVVWEYISPFGKGIDFTYRAYRYPYDYVPQLESPVEVAIEPIDIHSFRVEGAGEGMITEEEYEQLQQIEKQRSKNRLRSLRSGR